MLIFVTMYDLYNYYQLSNRVYAFTVKNLVLVFVPKTHIASTVLRTRGTQVYTSLRKQNQPGML